MTGRAEQATARYSTLLAVQVLGVTLIMLLLLSNFGTFINFATSAGFITAPALAYYNYRAVQSADVADRYTPSRALIIWHWIGFAALAVFAIAFVVGPNILTSMFKHIHIVACSPRSGTTLLHEVMVTCFKVDKHYDHEIRFHLVSADDGQILITKRPKDTMYMPAVIDRDPELYVILRDARPA